MNKIPVRDARMSRRNRAPKNREDGVSHAIEEHDQRIKPRQRSQPMCVACGERSQGEAQNNSGDESEEPFAKFERWHREPSVTLSHCDHGGVIHVEKSGSRFVENVQSKSDS